MSPRTGTAMNMTPTSLLGRTYCHLARTLYASLIILGTSYCSGLAAETAAVSVQWMGSIESPLLDESSGLAASAHHADVLWSINDSGGKAELFALTTQGKHLGIWPVDLPEPIDWEALTSFVADGTAYLLIADIGDNFAMRRTVSYVVVEEPDARTASPEEALQPVQTRSFSYPDGPRNSESVAVDTRRGEVLVLSKRTLPPQLYRLPLPNFSAAPSEVATQQVQRAELLGPLQGFVIPDRSTADFYGTNFAYMASPTGMSLAGDRLLVTTMEHAYVFDRANLAAPPQVLSLPYVGQREAITFALGSDTRAYVSQERPNGTRHAHILRLDITSQ